MSIGSLDEKRENMRGHSRLCCELLEKEGDIDIDVQAEGSKSKEQSLKINVTI